MTALHLAIIHNRDIAIDISVKSGIDIKSRTIRGETPLYVSARKGIVWSIESLIIRSTDINKRDY
jgi:ankyrin repeat protein